MKGSKNKRYFPRYKFFYKPTYRHCQKLAVTFFSLKIFSYVFNS